jgi:hypothetical protein
MPDIPSILMCFVEPIENSLPVIESRPSEICIAMKTNG